jgi:hypothetical protein
MSAMTSHEPQVSGPPQISTAYPHPEQLTPGGSP